MEGHIEKSKHLIDSLLKAKRNEHAKWCDWILSVPLTLQAIALLAGHLWFHEPTTSSNNPLPALLTIILPVFVSIPTTIAIGIVIIFRGTVQSRYTIATVFAIQPIVLTGSNPALAEPLLYPVIALALLALYGESRLIVFSTIVLLSSHLAHQVFLYDDAHGPLGIFYHSALKSAVLIVLTGTLLAIGLMASEKTSNHVESQRIVSENNFLNAKSAISTIQSQLDSAVSELKKEVVINKDLKIELAKAQKLQSIGQLAAGIAHEINTPAQYVSDNIRFIKDHFHNIIQIIEAYDELLDDSRENKCWEERAQSIKNLLVELDCDFLVSEIPLAIDQTLEGVERISHIVKAMKDYSHPGVDTKGYADLNQAICSTLAVCENRWKRVAEVKLDLDHALPQVLCFVAEINQVVLNLIVNASDAIEDSQSPASPRGQISVKTRYKSDYAEVYISDNGPGIPEDVKEKIFDPFFTTKDVGKGSGQGLCISHDVIVVRHGGELRCNSFPGQGTTFVIRLPLAPNLERSQAA